MTDTALDFSQRSEPALHGRILAAVGAVAEPLGIEPLIVDRGAGSPLIRERRVHASGRD